MIERRFVVDEEKFLTQKIVTMWLLAIFTFVVVWVFVASEEAAERSTVIQIVITLTTVAVAFWIGTSKGAADNRDQLNKMMQPQPESRVTTTIETPPEAK